jgi:hypothetical protein
MAKTPKHSFTVSLPASSCLIQLFLLAWTHRGTAIEYVMDDTCFRVWMGVFLFKIWDQDCWQWERWIAHQLAEEESFKIV